MSTTPGRLEARTPGRLDAWTAGADRAYDLEDAPVDPLLVGLLATVVVIATTALASRTGSARR